MEVEQLDVSALAEMAAPYNPRRISDHDLEALRRSLRFFGTVEPIVANRRTGRIVGGHQRVRAAEAEGLESLPVVWVDLDEPSEKQLNLALNRISGEWDDEKLREILDALDSEGADLQLTGFSDEEMRRLLGSEIEGVEFPNSVAPDPSGFQQMSFVLSDDQVETVKRALDLEKERGCCPSLGNENPNGCALYALAIRALSS